jgi:lipopolysaccharide transport system permease protein
MEYHITPPRGLLAINWAELWRFRDLFLTLAWRDISVRYKQAVLGVLWALLQPISTMLIFTFIFNRMANIQSGDGTPYPIFFYTGMIIWQYYSNTLSNAGNSMVVNVSLIQKVYFPRLIVPATAATTGLVDLAISSLVLIGLMAWYGFMPRFTGILILPVLLMVMVLSALGVGLFMAALNIKYRDVRYALPFVIQILMYLTPVIYPVRMLDKWPLVKTLMVWLNPISAVITNARAGLLGQSAFDFTGLAIACLMSSVMFILGLYYFRNTERYFADIA